MAKIEAGVSWETWMSTLSSDATDRIARKTGFKTADGGFNPDKSADFNNACNVAIARKLGLIPSDTPKHS